MKLRLSQRILTLLTLLLVMLLVACSGGGGGGGCTTPAAGDTFALDSNDNLFSFNRSNPATITLGPTAISGFLGTILGVDFRPADGQLYMLTDNNLGELYTVDTTTGVATLAASLVDDAAALPVFAGLVGTSFGVDFNPVTDRLRVTSDMNQNLRINVDDGTTVDNTNLAFAVGDVNVGVNPNVVASAYANSMGAASPILYDIDSNLDILTTQLSQAGLLSTVGPLGFDTDGNAGFDIDGSTGEAVATLNAPGTTSSSLFIIDLSTGTATNSGAIGDGTLTITSLALPTPVLVTVFVSDGTNLRSFTENSPEILRVPALALGGAFAGNLLGMDFRPSSGMLYILTDADADGINGTGTLYTVDTSTGIATLASNLSIGLPPSVGDAFAIDFDPVTDQLRVVDVANASNISVDVDTGIVTTDTNLVFDAGEDPLPMDGFGPRVSALAYSNNTAGAASSSLYGIDGLTDFLYTINPANAGLTQSVGALGGDVTASRTSFDISDTGAVLATLTLAGTTTTLNSIDLATGVATPIGVIGDGTVAYIGMSIAPSN